MANGNAKFAPGSWSESYQSSPGLIAIIFGTIGLVGFMAIMGIEDFVHSHTHRHRGIEEELFIGILVIGLALIAYGIHTVRKMWPATVKMVRGLQWYHWLWAVIFISGLVFRKRLASQVLSAPVDSAAAYRFVLVTVVGAVLLAALFLRRVEWLHSAFTGIIGVLLWFDMVTLLSTIWSVYWEWTLYKAVEYGVDVCMLAAALHMIRTTADYKKFFDWTWFLFGVMLLNVWFGCVWDPNDALLKSGLYGLQGIGGLGLWLQGVLPDVSSNEVGEFAGCITMVALCRLLPMNRQRENTSWYLFLFVAGFVTVIFAQTRSAVAGVGLAVFLVYLLSNRVLQGASIVFAGLVAAFPLGFGGTILDYLKRGQTPSQLASLSTRVEWWQVALGKFFDYPLTGLGMWAGSRFEVLAKIGYTRTASIHSDWVEVIVGTGAWGVILLVVLMAMAWWVLIKNTINRRLNMEDRQLAYEGMAVLAVVSVRMFFGTDLTMHPPCHIFVALGAAEFLRRKLKRREVRKQLPADVSPVGA